MILVVPVITLTLLSPISAMGATTVVGTFLLGVVDLVWGGGGEERERGRVREDEVEKREDEVEREK